MRTRGGHSDVELFPAVEDGPDSSREERFWRRSDLVAGADEVGRGCLAGPVVAAAIILPPYISLPGVRDSKQISAERREVLFDQIRDAAVSWSVCFRDARFVEEHNIVQASVRAMNTALSRLRPRPVHALIDGNYFHGDICPFTTIVKGDNRSISIAAASILAKVIRDRWMARIADREFPLYGFARHKGYATRIHRDALLAHGPCRLHRRTFIGRILNV